MTVEVLADYLLEQQLMVVTAESCTAGLVAKMLTDQAGSSRWFERGFVTYSNAAKQEMLDVSADLLAQQGAVSEAVVTEMCAGALQHSRSDVALAVSGIAGPDGGSPDKPVGTVWFGWRHQSGRHRQEMCVFSGNRSSIRQQSAEYAIDGLLNFLRDE
jgi:nicotinamide-nucleotide amidase